MLTLEMYHNSLLLTYLINILLSPLFRVFSSPWDPYFVNGPSSTQLILALLVSPLPTYQPPNPVSPPHKLSLLLPVHPATSLA